MVVILISLLVGRNGTSGASDKFLGDPLRIGVFSSLGEVGD